MSAGTFAIADASVTAGTISGRGALVVTVDVAGCQRER